MAEARQRDNWAHTGQILSLIANCNRNPKKKPQPFTALDFMPASFRPKKLALPWTAEEKRMLAKRAGMKVPNA